MALTSDQIAAVETEINSAASIASVLAPQYAGFIVLGQAVAKAAPLLYQDVQNLLANKAPTPADVTALATAIASLANPETL